MPDWVQTSLMNGTATSPVVLAYRMGAALLLGVGVAALYRWARRGESVAPTFLTTLVLLSTLIAMVTQVVGDNVARAFSLVGALSVVRFRTVVKDTQDTSFVILAVVVGMAAGANHLLVAIVGFGVLAVAGPILWPAGSADDWQSRESQLSLRVALLPNVQSEVDARLSASTRRATLVTVSAAKGGTAVDQVYRVILLPGVTALGFVSDLNALEGVSGVELARRED